ncbi:MAG: hypothetical protein J6V22_01925 [Clostridia bacterium]|nr:hypothetical protein [Clostridia bacterium]
MEKKRNGLLDLYRIFFCFWVLYYHYFFFFENTDKIYREAKLAVEFFFILSGIFLLNSIKRTDGLPFWKGCAKLMWGRLKPLVCTLAVVFCFNLIGIIVLASKDGFDFQVHVGTVFYLWFLPFMFFGVFMMYVLYRLIKNKYVYFILLAIFVVAGYAVQFGIEFSGKWTDQLPLSIARSLGGVSLGVLVSRIPVIKLRWKKINFNYLVLIVVLTGIIWMAREPRNAWARGGIIVLYALLIYFTLGTNLGGRGFDFIGAMSMRMYIYMAILCMLLLFGITYHRTLFFIDLILALTDMFLFGFLLKKLMKGNKKTIAHNT